VPILQSAYYLTTDMDRAVAFYRDVLGLSVKLQNGSEWAQLFAGGASLALASPREGAKGAVGATVIFQVEDLDVTRRALEAAGSEIVESREVSHGRSLAFRDPDDNLVQLFQRAAAPS
jgi:predicted enzyme related to lactoylglutathione lyase